jgi:hypothetical protein
MAEPSHVRIGHVRSSAISVSSAVSMSDSSRTLGAIRLSEVLRSHAELISSQTAVGGRSSAVRRICRAPSVVSSKRLAIARVGAEAFHGLV